MLTPGKDTATGCDAQHRTHARCSCARRKPHSPRAQVWESQTGLDRTLRGPCSTGERDSSGQSQGFPSLPNLSPRVPSPLLSALFSLPQHTVLLTLSPCKSPAVRSPTASASGKVSPRGGLLESDLEDLASGAESKSSACSSSVFQQSARQHHFLEQKRPSESACCVSCGCSF